jgi:hypothetical protein
MTEKPRAFFSLEEAMAALMERTGLKVEASDPGRLSDEVRERIERARGYPGEGRPADRSKAARTHLFR